jgi:hypothetical protein
MNLRTALVLSYFFFLSQNLFAQDIEATLIMETSSSQRNEIVYQKGLKLKQSDFQGAVDLGMNAVAMAYSGVSLKYGGMTKKGKILIEIRMYPSFNKSTSWCMEEHRNDRVLEHEQRHFDITVINACKLFRALQSYSFTKNFEQEIAELQKKYKQLNEEDQDIYDKATNHGINKEIQEEWNSRITKELAACSDCYN